MAHCAISKRLQAVAPFVLGPVPSVRSAITRRTQRQVVKHDVPLLLVAVPEDDRHTFRAAKPDCLLDEFLAGNSHAKFSAGCWHLLRLVECDDKGSQERELPSRITFLDTVKA